MTRPKNVGSLMKPVKAIVPLEAMYISVELGLGYSVNMHIAGVDDIWGITCIWHPYKPNVAEMEQLGAALDEALAPFFERIFRDIRKGATSS